MKKTTKIGYIEPQSYFPKGFKAGNTKKTAKKTDNKKTKK